MKSEFRRRIELLEEQFPTASAAVDPNAGETAFAKATAFVEAHGGREGKETWADAMARIMGMSTPALMASLSDNGRSHYLSAGSRT